MSIIAIMTISFGCYIFLPQQSSKISFNVTEVQSCDHLVIYNQIAQFHMMTRQYSLSDKIKSKYKLLEFSYSRVS